MTKPLEGCLVLDLAQVHAGPKTSMLLGDLGATVIKVERPGGDQSRRPGPSPKGAPFAKAFAVLNRNKRSIVLDLTQRPALDVLYKLVERADIVIQNFLPETTEKLGIDYESLARINPRLIYVAISGFGTQGPYADKPAYDLILQGLSGSMAARRMPDGSPMASPIYFGDASAPYMIGFAVMVALMERDRTGLGQKLETSILQAQIGMQTNQLVRLKEEEQVSEPGQATYNVYRCSDGEYITVTTLNEPQWRHLCETLDLTHLLEDPEYATVSKRAAHSSELYSLFEAVLASRPSHEWIARLQAVEVPCGPIITRDQVFHEPQILENGMFVTVDQPGMGELLETAFPVSFSRSTVGVQRPAPFLGEHTDEVLQELGYSQTEIGRLREEHCIA